MSTRFWGGSITLTDAQAAELFGRYLPLQPVPPTLSARITARVQREVRWLRLRTTVSRSVGRVQRLFFSDPPPATPAKPPPGGDRATVQDHRDRANDLKDVAKGGKGK